jgi:hypothetical protein
LVVLISVPGTALAQNPHFVTGPNASIANDGSGDLVISWKESGLGNNVTATYTGAATSATAIYACINGGGKHPSATNKENETAPVSCTGTFTSGKNGSITASLTCEPPGAGGFTCPSGQTMEVTFVSYTGISLSDDTFHDSAGVTPSNLSACLISGSLANDTDLCPR